MICGPPLIVMEILILLPPLPFIFRFVFTIIHEKVEEQQGNGKRGRSIHNDRR